MENTYSHMSIHVEHTNLNLTYKLYCIVLYWNAPTITITHTALTLQMDWVDLSLCDLWPVTYLITRAQQQSIESDKKSSIHFSCADYTGHGDTQRLLCLRDSQSQNQAETEGEDTPLQSYALSWWLCVDEAIDTT